MDKMIFEDCFSDFALPFKHMISFINVQIFLSVALRRVVWSLASFFLEGTHKTTHHNNHKPREIQYIILTYLKISQKKKKK